VTTRQEVFPPFPGYGKETVALGKAQSVTFSPDGGLLAALSAGGTVGVWDLTTGQLRYSLADHPLRASIAFSPDGRQLATGNGFGIAHIWDAQTGRRPLRLDGGHIH